MNHLTTITLLEKGNHKTSLTPTRVAFHSPCTIVEAQSADGAIYYAYFYRQQFLAAKKVTRSKRGSYLEQAMTKGIVFLCPHPLASKLLLENQTIKNRSLTQLLSWSKQRFTLIEVSNIFSCLDSLIQEEKLFKVMRDSYYTYRRDGKWGKAYSVLLSLENTFPNHEWVTHTKHDAAFSAYHSKYETLSPALAQSDPSTLEWLLWTERSSSDHRAQWLTVYGQDPACSLSAFALLCEEHEQSDREEAFPFFLDQAKRLFTQNEQKELLLHMTKAPRSYIHKEAFRQCIRLQEWEEAMTTLIEKPFPLEPQDVRSVKEAMSLVRWDHTLPIEQLSMVLIPILKDEKHDLDLLLTACIPVLSKTHGLPYLINWLKPLEEVQCHLPIHQKVKNLVACAEDPDKQAQAGELYYSLGLKGEAIESFSYEMELKPDDPAPVKWLFTLYRETGKLDEATAYQQLLQTMR
ncbi:hypothetical protein [Jeotgalibacillus campisalis]|uniref:Tetratricopeptide repeat protein n=1 Tax=Jeotgalibacillus campisalis TaxID=220754 RepID=A0A0C2SFQ4_9BACL|nr:hypothetical protein [Jeotgalibacillus campisalis]KIL52759.1 hypothetical protein KR50_00880 [Jeotgalibacillus campisalis]